MASKMTGQIVVRFNHFDKIAGDGRDKARDLVRKTALRIEAYAKASMHGGGTPHRPSAPGTPPNIDLAVLVNSIQTFHVGELTSVVRVGADYGLDLELGTRRMAARPFMAPAAKHETSAFIDGMKGIYKQ